MIIFHGAFRLWWLCSEYTGDCCGDDRPVYSAR